MTNANISIVRNLPLRSKSWRSAFVPVYVSLNGPFFQHRHKWMRWRRPKHLWGYLHQRSRFLPLQVSRWVWCTNGRFMSW